MKDSDVKLHIIAILPHLKYLDYNVITHDQLRQALKKYSPENEKHPHQDEVISDGDSTTFKYTFHAPDKEAYVDELANGQGFQILLKSERNFELLLTFPPASHITTEYCSKASEVFDIWHEKGHKYYKKIQHEKQEFLSMISKAKEFALETSRNEELKFIDLKIEMPKQLCMIYQNHSPDDERDRKVMEYKKNCESNLQVTHQQLINSTFLYLDLVSNICKIYEKEVSLINASYIQDVENFVQDIIDINKTYANRFQDFYFSLYDSGFDSTEEIKTETGDLFKLDPSFLLLMQKKDLIKMTLELATRIHSTLLHRRLIGLKSSLQNDIAKTLNEVADDTFFRQSEESRNIVIFCNKQKCFIDKFFQKNPVFKHYLGYRA